MTPTENIQLTEIYRRLGYFKNWNLDSDLLTLHLPSEIKTLKAKDILKPSYKEIPRVLNWYNLTKKGKELLKKHIPKSKKQLTEAENLQIFEGKKQITF